MPEALPPFLVYLTGAVVVACLRGRLRQIVALAVPVLALLNHALLAPGVHWRVDFLDFELILGRVDAASVLFLNLFALLSFIGILYVIRENEPLDLAGGLLYAGSAIGAVLAGDLITLFFFWEMLTLGAVLCLLARRTKASGRAAMRYLLVHVFGGVVLLAGLVLHLAAGGSTAFDRIALEGTGAWLMLLGFGINCAWPLVGAWLADTYPEASPGGVVFMATFTTKTAVYVLSRTFPGESVLLWIGVVMAVLPLFYAVIENDLRRVLAYALVNQVGIMIIGVGIGTDLALNGTSAQAFVHVLYKALLFMAIGSVILRTGKSRASDLGGLCRSMPLTCLFCCVASATIVLSGLVGKAMIKSEVGHEGLAWVWFALLFASAGAFVAAGIRVPYAAFFRRDSGIRCQEAPLNQLLAMGFTAGLCLLVCLFPGTFLYPMLPHPETAVPALSIGKITGELSLAIGAVLAFVLLVQKGLYPADLRATNLDASWLYRKGGPALYRLADKSLNPINAAASRLFLGKIVGGIANFFESGLPRLACLFMTPFWKFMGHDTTRIEEERHSLFRRAKIGAFPIGITAFSAVILLGLLTAYYYVSDK
jgi:multicomponent Na+:H+ antiporter subunit D